MLVSMVVVVFKEKALFNFVRTFLRELDLLALDLNLSLFDRATTETTTKSRGIARFRSKQYKRRRRRPSVFVFVFSIARDDDGV